MVAQTTDLTLTATDGAALGASQFVPKAAPTRAVVIAGAMGVPQRFYAALATFLATQGIGVVTFDYRGIGRSLHGPLRAERGRLSDWGEHDLEAALQHARTTWPDAPLAVVTHSVGGQLLGMAPTFASVDRALTVGSQSGYWKLWPGIGSAVMWGVWHVAIPLLTPLFGYLPMKRVGMGENVPRHVAREWARSGRDPNYLWGYFRDRPSMRGYATWRGRLRAIDVSDDALAPTRTVDGLVAHYPAAIVTRETLTPASVGVAKIGHFGAFRESMRDALWADWTRWLLAP